MQNTLNIREGLNTSSTNSLQYDFTSIAITFSP